MRAVFSWRTVQAAPEVALLALVAQAREADAERAEAERLAVADVVARLWA